jgi:hypothetical protein
METQVATVQVDVQSRAASLREDTRQRSYQSLAFFLTSVLRVPVPEQVAEDLQRLGLRRLVMLVAGTALWCRLHKAKAVDHSKHDAIRWLFPEVRD